MNAEQTLLLRKAAEKLGAARVLIEAGYNGSAVSEALFEACCDVLFSPGAVR